MNRDLVLQVVAAADAKLRRIERLAGSIRAGEELQTRIPPLIADVRRDLQSLTDRVAALEGG